MSDVKRYDPVGAGHGAAWMEPESNGDYVTYDDYTALQARLAKVEAERDGLQNEKSALLARVMELDDISESMTAQLATARRDALEDGRPCSTDVWMVAAIEQLDDKWDFFEACKDWCEGNWEGAMVGITIRAIIAQEENKP